jgi:hypothetical protein
VKVWWEQWAGRLEFEIEALEAIGARIDQRRTDGFHLTINLTYAIGGEEREFRVEFPDYYPFTRFELFTAPTTLPRHQHPFDGNLCTIADPNNTWRTDDYVAKFLQEQLPRVFEAATSNDPDRVAELEFHQGEPFSHYYHLLPSVMFVVDGAWTLPADLNGGRLEVYAVEDTNGVRGIISEVSDSHNRPVATVDPKLLRENYQRFEGRWVRLDQPLRVRTGQEFAFRLFAQEQALRKRKWHHLGRRQVELIGVVFPEEVAWRQTADGWIFLLITKGDKGRENYDLVRAGRGGVEDLRSRIPELGPLRNRSVAVFGLGCVGAPSVLEFARAGVGKLRLLDFDTVEPGTTVRWPLGLGHIGAYKTDALQRFIRAEWPYTDVDIRRHRIGIIGNAGGGDANVLPRMLEGSNLVYDATAELNIQRLLFELAREHRLPYVAVSTTAGAWGGLVFALDPRETDACWDCVQHALREQSIPIPPAAATGWVEPQGCNSPTFTGSSFDIMQVPAMGVRQSVSLLCRDEAEAYPQAGWDYASLALRSSTGEPLPPTWQTGRISRHSECPNH